MRSRLRHIIAQEIEKRRDKPAFLRRELRAAAREITRHHRKHGMRARLDRDTGVLTLDFDPSSTEGCRFALVSVHDDTGQIRCERLIHADGAGHRKDPRRPDSVYMDSAEDLLAWYAAAFVETTQNQA